MVSRVQKNAFASGTFVSAHAWELIVIAYANTDWRQMAIENTFYLFLIRVRRLLKAFSIAAYPVRY